MNRKPKLTKQNLLAYEPCGEGHRFILKHPDLRTAWCKCTDPAHMLWALTRLRPLSERMKKRIATEAAAHVRKAYGKAKPGTMFQWYVAEAESGARNAALYSPLRSARLAYASYRAQRREQRWQCDLIRKHVKPFAVAARGK